MTNKTKHCSLTYYKGHLVTEFHTVESIDNELVSPYDKPGNLGFVVLDVAHVGVSKEAYEALKTLKRGSDGLGDIDIFRADDKHVFASLGGACTVRKVSKIETSRDWRLSDLALEDFQVIENEVPEGAKEAIDNPSDEEDDE